MTLETSWRDRVRIEKFNYCLIVGVITHDTLSLQFVNRVDTGKVKQSSNHQAKYQSELLIYSSSDQKVCESDKELRPDNFRPQILLSAFLNSQMNS